MTGFRKVFFQGSIGFFLVFFVGLLSGILLFLLSRNEPIALAATSDEPLLAIAPPTSRWMIPAGSKSPGCLDNFQSWNSSQVFTSDGNWSTALFDFNSANGKIETLQDLNGDALPDFLSVNVYGQQYQENISACVMLNNGRGWDITYRCVSVYNYSTNQTTFYGDCAG